MQWFESKHCEDNLGVRWQHSRKKYNSCVIPYNHDEGNFGGGEGIAHPN